MTSYEQWIAAFVARHDGKILGVCRRACDEMRAAFPELREVRGHVYVPGWGKRAHAWLVDERGGIVDPTAEQFPVIDTYEPWQPGDEVMVGKCMECGSEIWQAVQTLAVAPPRREFCDDECANAFAADLGFAAGGG